MNIYSGGGDINDLHHIDGSTSVIPQGLGLFSRLLNTTSLHPGDRRCIVLFYLGGITDRDLHDAREVKGT